MDQQKHWNNIGQSYNGEIFDVFRNDRNKRLSFYFDKHANKKGSAMDFGCGTGKAFPYLSPRFRSLLGVDISKELLKEAGQRPFSNVTLKEADLSSRKVKLPPTDFIFCCNVIMLPEIEKNRDMIANIGKALRRGGHGLVVLPSLESMLYASWRMMEWYKKEGTPVNKIPAEEMDYFRGDLRDLVQGIVYIDGVPTKHYMEPELRILFEGARLTVTAIERLEYKWDTEFSSPPSWMKAPYPWDWLIECTKH